MPIWHILMKSQYFLLFNFLIDNIQMTSIDLYTELVQVILHIDRDLLDSQRLSQQSVRDAQADQFQSLVKKIKQLQEHVSINNRQILRLKDKLVINAKQDKEEQYCLAIKKTCDQNYLLITEMREKLLASNKLVEQYRVKYPNQPETFSRVYRNQHIAEQVDKILNQSYTIQKLVQKFSFDTTLKRIRLVLPEISQNEAQKMAFQRQGLMKAMKIKIAGKASLKLKYTHEDILSKAEGIAKLQASIEQNLKLMKQVSLLVYKQGQILNNIFKNVEKAKDYVARGEQKLKIETEQHKKTKKKICCIIFIGLIVLALIVVPIVLNSRKQST